ncbi:hypothetical protein SHKM778_19590 [Streptomyces sp. KM77-8]|uniref:Uncharacterized protein n=1 Tax=Streptomyces haneummycinicus TaxID=3074435 RepID=A0AAT9HDU8_9ACTN
MSQDASTARVTRVSGRQHPAGLREDGRQLLGLRRGEGRQRRADRSGPAFRPSRVTPAFTSATAYLARPLTRRLDTRHSRTAAMALAVVGAAALVARQLSTF